MPYSRDDTPAAWWHGAEPLPPKPDETRCDAPAAGPPFTTAVVGSRAFTDIPDGGAREALALLLEEGTRIMADWDAVAQPAAEVRLGDPITRDGVTLKVVGTHRDFVVASRFCYGVASIPLSDIGSLGSGKPWMLLPRIAPGANALSVYAPGGDLVARVGPGESAHIAAIRTLERMGYTYHGSIAWKPPLGPTPDFAPMGAAAARREALERVAEAARGYVNCTSTTPYTDVEAALLALAALDGDGGA